MTDEPIALIMLGDVCRTVGQALDDTALLCHRYPAQRPIVVHQALRATPIATLKQLPGLADEAQLPTRIDAFAQQGRCGQTKRNHPIYRSVGFSFRATEQAGITTQKRAPSPVKTQMRYPSYLRLPCHISTELNATHGQRAWINDRQ
ncbi:hypothetical protein PsgB076_20697 [Pseudomonas savastanoi pv. glycinea str. B076]|nr:hypothetical protein PsgB076_20697 [Pseudomonas savastanoi pv. glycinea str. B076]